MKEYPKHPTVPTASILSPCPTVIQVMRTPRHWRFENNCTPPAGKIRQTDVVLTSMRQYNVASMLVRRHYDAMCLLGKCKENDFPFKEDSNQPAHRRSLVRLPVFILMYTLNRSVCSSPMYQIHFCATPSKIDAMYTFEMAPLFGKYNDILKCRPLSRG